MSRRRTTVGRPDRTITRSPVRRLSPSKNRTADFAKEHLTIGLDTFTVVGPVSPCSTGVSPVQHPIVRPLRVVAGQQKSRSPSPHQQKLVAW